jgi:hypothetical protein
MSLLSGSDYGTTRFVFQRALAFMYLIGFLIAFNQARPLIGDHGLLPAKNFIREVEFWDSPSIFHWHVSDFALAAWALVGIVLATVALLGISDSHGVFISVATWTALWAIYLSFVNVGQVFYGYGWETMLLETGFLAIFLGPKSVPTPVVVIWLFRWILFRLMFGAGMIKLRGDPCWRDLTCMFYHYETQPLPNPLSWYFHHLPKAIHKLEVLFTHFTEIVVPIFYFFPRTIGYIAGAITIVFQITLILSGNLSWLNYLTIVLCIPCFDDNFWLRIFPSLQSARNVESMQQFQQIAIGIVFFLIAYLSYRPAKNLFSDRRMMNASFDSLHLVNTYGAFGSITKERYEVILEGTEDLVPSKDSLWKEYEFKAKPGDVNRCPSIVSPYHYKIDWQMWFAAMSDYRQHPWIVNLIAKLLEGDKATLALMGKNPFPEKAPHAVRAELYLYNFADSKSKSWWTRKLVSTYLPPLSLDNEDFQKTLRQQGWKD